MLDGYGYYHWYWYWMNDYNNVVMGYLYHADTLFEWNESIKMRWEMIKYTKFHKCNNNDNVYNNNDNKSKVFWIE